MSASPSKPSWDRLYQLSAGQSGYFTTAQGARVGYSPQLLAKHARHGRLQRVRRGIYRIVHFPAGDREELAILWLWSDRKGVFSHETALGVHGLSDSLSARIHMTMPKAWAARRLRIPGGLELHFSSVPREDRTWHGSVPVTAPARTLCDCARADVSPLVVGQALEEGFDRALFTRAEVGVALEYLARFGEPRK